MVLCCFKGSGKCKQYLAHDSICVRVWSWKLFNDKNRCLHRQNSKGKVMEEKQKEIKTVSQEEIKLLTFNPEMMLNEIKKLKDELYSSTMDNGYLSMINIDLTAEVERLRKRSFRNLLQELLLRSLGGQWIEEKS
jgi:hypothetical protein